MGFFWDGRVAGWRFGFCPVHSQLQVHLREQGIGAAIHYPVPVHLQLYYAENGFHRGQFPVTEQVCDQILSLPMFPGMTVEQVQRVAAVVNQFSD